MIFVWTLQDVIGLALLAIAGMVLGWLWIADAWRRWRCKHDGSYGETMSCDAICHKCGANLGFIGAWRDRQRKTHSQISPEKP